MRRSRRARGPQGGSVITPLSILGGPSFVKIWTRSDLGVTLGTGVSAWADQSGNSLHFVQATGAAQPTLTATGPNGLPGILFDGTAQFMDAPGPDLAAPGTTPIYYWFVGRQITGGASDSIIRGQGGSPAFFQTAVSPNVSGFCGVGVNGPASAWTVGVYKRIEWLLSNQASDYIKIGAASATGNAGNTDPTAGSAATRLCRQNASGTQYANAELCEFLLYQGPAPTTAQRAALDAYSLARYGSGVTT